MAADTRVPWHRRSPATRYGGAGARSDSWLADTDHPSYTHIPAEGRPRRGGRGAEVPGLWEMVPPPPCSASSPGWSCWGSPTSGLSIPRYRWDGAQGHGEKGTPEVTCGTPRREVAALPSQSPVQSTEREVSTSLVLPRGEKPHQPACHPIATRPAPLSRPKPGRQTEGRSRPGDATLRGARGSLGFGDILGGFLVSSAGLLAL